MRPLVVKLSYTAKDLIMDNVATLKDQSNPVTGQKYFIAEQTPEGIIEQRKQTSNRAKHLKSKNEGKPKQDQKSIQVINGKILIDGQIDQLEVTTPQPMNLFLNAEEQKKVNEIQQQLVETELKTSHNSKFRALAIRVNTIEEVNCAYVAVCQRYPMVDHAMMAYALKEQEELKSGFCDDKEYGAGIRLKKLLFEEKSKNLAVFVVRKYGGLHMGFNRFNTIENIARAVIQALNI